MIVLAVMAKTPRFLKMLRELRHDKQDYQVAAN